MSSQDNWNSENNHPNPLLAKLGWQHRGFRVEHRSTAVMGLFVILLIPFLVDMAGTVRGFGKSSDPADANGSKGYGDFAIYHEAATNFTKNPSIDLYETHTHYLYPPFFLSMIMPLTHLPDKIAIGIFEIAKWVALFLCLQLAWKLVCPRKEDSPPIVALGSLFLAARFFHNDIGNGNINTFILLCVLFAGWLIRRRHRYTAGFVVGVATCIKVTPVLVLIYFIYKGWWRTVFGAVAACVFCLAIFPGVIFGWENNWIALNSWFSHLVAPNVADNAAYSIANNQSISALLNRLLGGQLAIEKPATVVSSIVLPSKILGLIRLVLSLGILGLIGFVCKKRIVPGKHALAFSAELSLVLIAMVSISGYSWKAHFVILLLPFTVLLAYLADARYPTINRKWIKRLLIAAGLLVFVSTDIITRTPRFYLEAFGVILMVAWLSAIGVILVHINSRNAHDMNTEKEPTVG